MPDLEDYPEERQRDPGVRERATDNVPPMERPRALMWFLVVVAAIGILGVIAQVGIASSNRGEIVTAGAIRAGENRVEGARHRIENEEGDAEICLYIREVMVQLQPAIVDELDAMSNRCQPENLHALQEELERAKRELRKIDPKNPLLEEDVVRENGGPGHG